MKRRAIRHISSFFFISLFYVLVSNSAAAQTQFWIEDFENGCASNCLASGYSGANGAWSVVTLGANGTCPNEFFVSCAENGEVAPNCGVGCGTDESLHIGSQICSPWAPAFCPTGDCGAAYDAGNACDALSCAFFLCTCGATGAEVLADRAAVSPVINLGGLTGISVQFDYIENGSGASDDASFQYFDGSGPGWVTVALPKTATCFPLGQGQWTTFSFNFPATIDGRADFQIRFRWVNNTDGAGTDPSFAVDDVRLFHTPPLPVELVSFTGTCDNGMIKLDWTTASEVNNDFFVIERSSDAAHWNQIARVDGQGNSNVEQQYQFLDTEANARRFYRLVQVDFDGTETIHYPISVLCKDPVKEVKVYPNPSSGVVYVSSDQTLPIEGIEIVTIDGKTVSNQPLSYIEGKNNVQVDLTGLDNGIYFMNILAGNSLVVKRLIINH